MKRILAVLLCALMLAGILPLGVLAEDLPEEQPEVEIEEAVEESAPVAAPASEEEPAPEPGEAAEEPAEEPAEQPAEEPAAEEPAAPAEEPAAEKDAEPFVEVMLIAEEDSYQVGDTVTLTALYLVDGEKEEAEFAWYTVSENKEKTLIPDQCGEEYIFEALEAGEFRFVAAVGKKFSKVLTVVVTAPAEEPEEESEEELTEELPAVEAPAEEPVEIEAPAEEPAEVEAPAEEPAEVEAPAEETAEAEAPAEEPAEAEAPAEEPAETEAPAEGEELAGEPAELEEGEEESELELEADPVPEWVAANVLVNPSTITADLYEPVTLEVPNDPSMFVDATIVNHDKTKYEWYKHTSGGTDVKIKTTIGVANNFIVINPGALDDAGKGTYYYCKVTAYNAKGGASVTCPTANNLAITLNSPFSCDTAACGITGVAGIQALIAASGEEEIKIVITNEIKVTTSLTIPENVSIIIAQDGLLIVSLTGGNIINNGSIYICAYGAMDCHNANRYTGTRIICEDENATLIPTTIPHGVKSVSLDSITNFEVGKKVLIQDPNNPGNYEWVAGTGVPAKVKFSYEPYNAGDLTLTYTTDNPNPGTHVTVKKIKGEDYLILPKSGVQTITATDGSITVTADVRVADYKLSWSDNRLDPYHNFVDGGEQIVYTVRFEPANVTDTVFLAPWFKDSKDEEYGSLSMHKIDENTYTVTLSAKTVTEVHDVVINLDVFDKSIPTTSIGDSSFGTRIFPAPTAIRIMWDDDYPNPDINPDIDVTDQTFYYNTADPNKPVYKFYALVLPSDAYQAITWDDDMENGQANITPFKDGEVGSYITLTKASDNGGEFTITAKTYSGVTVDWNVKVMDIDTSIAFAVPDPPQYFTARAGASVECPVTLGTPEACTVKWYLDQGADPKWGTIKEKTGVFTATRYANGGSDGGGGTIDPNDCFVPIIAKLLVNGKEVKVFDPNTNQMEPVKAETSVLVVPSPTKAFIKKGTEVFLPGATLYMPLGKPGAMPNSWEMVGLFTPGTGQFDETYEFPGTWTSSNQDILGLPENQTNSHTCYVYAKAEGTSTLTFAADDGSGVKTSVKVVVSRLVSKIELWSDAGYSQKEVVLSGGSSLQLYPVITPTDAVTPKLKYQVINCHSDFTPNDYDTGVYASVSSSGKVSAKTVYSNHYVIIRATSTDGGAVYGDYQLMIQPKDTSAQYLLITHKEANNFVRDVTGTTLDMDILAGTKLDLGYLNAPYGVIWSSSKPSVLEVNSIGQVKFLGSSLSRAATYTITATDAKNMTKKSTVKIRVTKLVNSDSLSITTKSGLYVMAGGTKLTLKATVASTAFNKKVSWSVDPMDRAFCSISSSGVLTAKRSVDEAVTVTVYATAKDGGGATVSQQVFIYPRASYISIDDGNDNIINNKTVIIDRNDAAPTLTAIVAPADAIPEVTWKSSNKKVAYFDEYGDLQLTGRVGKATISCRAVDGSKKTAKFTLRVVAKVENIRLDPKTKNLFADTSGWVVRGGTTAPIKVKFFDSAWDPMTPTDKKIIWRIDDPADLAYASITSSGKLKTISVTGAHKITLTAVPHDDPEETNVQTFDVWIKPGVSKLAMLSYPGPENVSGETITVTVHAGDTQQFGVEYLPFDASDAGKWTSSSSKIATVDQTGLVTYKKAGTVTITYKAMDGTNKRVSVRLKVKIV